MRAVLAAYGVNDRKVYVADSFAGLPPPAPEIFPADAGDTCHTHRFLSIPLEAVVENFRRYGLLDEQVVFLKGWFEDTLPTAPMSQLAVIRLDGDMYGSTMIALQNLYPKLSPGGFCIIDDYALKGCRQDRLVQFVLAEGIARRLRLSPPVRRGIQNAPNPHLHWLVTSDRQSAVISHHSICLLIGYACGWSQTPANATHE